MRYYIIAKDDLTKYGFVSGVSTLLEAQALLDGVDDNVAVIKGIELKLVVKKTVVDEEEA